MDSRAALLDCPACDWRGCKGGGNLRCKRRDPQRAVLAGILDTYGGLRFIVASKKSLRQHVRHDEVLIVVPGLYVHEPIAWNDIPIVIERIRLTVQAWIDAGIPNDPVRYEAATMYRLRCLEHEQESFDLNAICET